MITAPQPMHGVVPSLAELIALRARVHAWPPAQRASGSRTGPATSPLRGRGMDYAESRPYAQGDDARHIDWRVTARTGRAHTKVFHAERDRTSVLVADTSPTMYFGTRSCFKSVQAARAGALAAWAAERSGDRITALRGTRGEAPRPPAGGTRGALRSLDALARWYAAPPADDVGVAHALDAAARIARPGARVLALLDPRSVETVPEARWTALSAHHEAIALLLVDPLELDPPHARVAFASAGARIELGLDERGARERWERQFAQRFAHARESLQRLGWRTLELRTDQKPDEVLALLLPYRREVA